MCVCVCVRVNSSTCLTKERALLNTHDMLPLSAAPALPPCSTLCSLHLLPVAARCEGLLAAIVNRRTGCGFAIRRSYDYEKDEKDDDDGDDNERVLSNVCT